MGDIAEGEVAIAAGVVTRSALMRAGWTAREIRRALRRGSLAVIRPGWYRTGTADAAVVAAVRGGAVLGCVSALARHGIWVPPTRTEHLRASEHRRRVSPAHYCSAYRELGAPRTAVDPLLTAFACAARCLTAEEFVAVCDSLLHRHPELDIPDLRDTLAGAPRRVTDLLRHVDRRAESGTESLVRYRLGRRNIAVSIQVTIGGVGRVDLLVGRSLIVECDSRTYHSGRNYQRDRTRDQAATALGYEVFRVTWEDVTYRWAAVEEKLLILVRRGDHLGRRLTG